MKLSKQLKNKVLFWINLILVLLFLNILSINIIKISKNLSYLISTYFLFTLLIINIPLTPFYESLKNPNKYKLLNLKLFFSIFLVLISLIFFFMSNEEMIKITTIPIITSGLFLLLHSFGIKRQELAFLSIGSFIYALLFIFIQTIPLFWISLQRFSLFFSNFTASLMDQTMLLGPSISGIWIIISFISLYLGILIFSNFKKRTDFSLNLIGLFFCWGIYLMIISIIGFKNRNNADDYLIYLFLISLIPTFYYIKQAKSSLNSDGIQKIKRPKIKKILTDGGFWALILIIISAFVITSFYPTTHNSFSEKKSILFYGQNQLADWKTPEYSSSFRNINEGMFGILPCYLNMAGYKINIMVDNIYSRNLNIFNDNKNSINLSNFSTIVESAKITEDLLANIDIFVVINLQKSFENEEKKIIWEFVRNGGSLLVLGDHTDVGDIKKPLNDLLSPFGIKYRFDSAIPINKDLNDWKSCYHLSNHVICEGIDNSYEIQTGIGASLNITESSIPILTGKFAFSDIGDSQNYNQGKIGDLKYNKNEQIGDIILAASSYYGKGKVLVFGDTTSFINPQIPYTSNLILNSFNWLGSDDSVDINNAEIILSIILITLAIILLMGFNKKIISFSCFTLFLCLTLIISTNLNSLTLKKENILGKTAIIDISHNERINIAHSTNDSIDEMMLHITANGYIPLLQRDFSNINLENCQIIIFNAPTEIFSKEKVKIIKNFISEGGLVILATGFEDKSASMPLLEEFHLDIKKDPLGQLDYDAGFADIKFVDAWPIEILDSSNLEIFYNYKEKNFGYNHTTIVFKTFNKGGFLLISDSKFILDKNMEWFGNSKFMAIIFNALYERGVLK